MPRHSWLDDIDDSDDIPPGRPSGSRKGKKKGAGKGPALAELGDTSILEDELYLDDEDTDIAEMLERKAREKRRAEISEPFKCRNCRAFIGEPPSGGRQRNHCPICLYSLHVDDKTPGDRASDCRSLMMPVGTFYRPNLEQMVVHECLGCGFVRYNRVAADDNPILLGELPSVDRSTLVRTDESE